MWQRKGKITRQNLRMDYDKFFMSGNNDIFPDPRSPIKRSVLALLRLNMSFYRQVLHVTATPNNGGDLPPALILFLFSLDLFVSQ